MREKALSFFSEEKNYFKKTVLDDIAHHKHLTTITAWGFSMLELIRDKDINSEEELYNRIKHLFPKHVEILYNAVCDYLSIIKSSVKVSRDECYLYYYNVFIIKTMKGRYMELNFKEILERRFNDVRFATAKEDGMYGVDIVVEGICGIQVKPISYYHMDREDIKALNESKYKRFEEKYGLRVIEVYYDKNDNDKWLVIDEEFKKLYYSLPYP